MACNINPTFNTVYGTLLYPAYPALHPANGGMSVMITSVSGNKFSPRNFVSSRTCVTHPGKCFVNTNLTSLLHKTIDELLYVELLTSKLTYIQNGHAIPTTAPE